ncbi:MAG: suppressor of loss of ypt1 [Piccolia ochrophora]|nr:MAG: suppressor of loss of ypt1 [Piccolia ochrophora]
MQLVGLYYETADIPDGLDEITFVPPAPNITRPFSTGSMPHSTATTTERRSSSSATRSSPHKPLGGYSMNSSTEPLPPYWEEAIADSALSSATSARFPSLYPDNDPRYPANTGERWKPSREMMLRWESNVHGPGARHGRQKSLSDAIKTIRTRRGSVTENAQELAEALKAPVSPKLIGLCLIWYLNSALTNTSSKSILNAFPNPATLTLIQFAFVSTWCILLAYAAKVYPRLRDVIPALRFGIRAPSRDILTTTLPLAVFQVGGHLLSSTATAKIPVSLVHTIKGLSPLFTVLAYRFIFQINYSSATYLSLIPLTLGVMLACSAELSGNLFGILCAFGGALIFVTQNIFSKKLFNEAAHAEVEGQSQKSRKLDKLNLLCYSSALAFTLTAPLWLWSEGFTLLADLYHDGALDLSGKRGSLGSRRLMLEFIFNGTFHFGQNIMAFVLLSMVSPVTYSVASLVKRIFVIVVAIVWFGSRTTPVQATGIMLTFLGLYLYDRTSDAARTDRRAKVEQIRNQEPILPLATNHLKDSTFVQSPSSASSPHALGKPSFLVGGINRMNGDEKKVDAAGPRRSRGASNSTMWLPPGTRQEDTWRSHDMAATNGPSVS